MAELLDQAREVTVTALSNQHVPFDAVVEAVNPARADRRMPLITANLVLQDPVRVSYDGSGLTCLTDVEEALPTSPFDVFLDLMPAGDELHGSLSFATEVMTMPVAQWLCAAFTECARAIADEPGLSLARLSTAVATSSRHRQGRQLRRSSTAGQQQGGSPA